MSKISRIPSLRRCHGRAPIGASAAFVLALLLAGCQGGMSPDENASGQSSAALMKVADETRAGGDLGTAISLYRRVHEMRPTDAKPLEKLGSTLTQLGAYTEAATAFRAGLDLDESNPDLHRGLAVVLLSLNQPEPAVHEAEAALKKREDDPRLYNIMGVAQDLMGRHEQAQDAYLNGLRLAPKSNGLRNNYGLSLALTGDYGAAATTLTEIADDPAAPPRYRLNLALVYGLAGDDKKASSIARTALDEAAVRNNLSYYALLRRMDDKARTNAIIGGQLHGNPSEAPEQTASTSKDATAEAAPQPAATPASAEKPADKDAPATATAAPGDANAQASNAAPTTTAEASGPPVPLAPAGTPDAANASPAATDQPPAAAQDQPATAGQNPNDAANTASAAPAAPADQAAAPADQAQAAAPAAPGDANAGDTPATETAAAAPAPADAPAKPAAPVAQGAYFVQFGSFSIENNAHKLADQLGQKGYKVAVVRHRDHGGREWYAVRGGYPSAAEAEAAARQAHDSEQVPAVVLHRAGQA
jgi:Flp pilus assembly protein TadD